LVRKILKIFIVEIKKFEKFNVEFYYHTDHLSYVICKKKRKKRKMTFACTSICTSHKTHDIYNFNTCIYIYERARVYRV